jgi:hypothetical protein
MLADAGLRQQVKSDDFFDSDPFTIYPARNDQTTRVKSGNVPRSQHGSCARLTTLTPPHDSCLHATGGLSREAERRLLPLANQSSRSLAKHVAHADAFMLSYKSEAPQQLRLKAQGDHLIECPGCDFAATEDFGSGCQRSLPPPTLIFALIINHDVLSSEGRCSIPTVASRLPSPTSRLPDATSRPASTIGRTVQSKLLTSRHRAR